MFTTRPTYNPYRVLAIALPVLVGEDVFALQTALAVTGQAVGESDGVFGQVTKQAVRSFQLANRLTSDGKAGQVTQRALAMAVADRVGGVYNLPTGLLKGQLGHESSYLLGNYSAARPDGSYDAGVAQRNTAQTSAREAFDVMASIDALGARVRKHFDLFNGVARRRRWQLAQGSWNAPAYACYLARQEGAVNVTRGMTAQPGSAALRTFEQYVADVSIYLEV